MLNFQCLPVNNKPIKNREVVDLLVGKGQEYLSTQTETLHSTKRLYEECRCIPKKDLAEENVCQYQWDCSTWPIACYQIRLGLSAHVEAMKQSSNRGKHTR